MSEIYTSMASSSDRVARMAEFHVEVIADLICPFCYLGKRQLDNAMRAVKGPSEISWYPYQLNPEMPSAGMPFGDYLMRRFGNPKNIQPVLDRLAAEGHDAGIEFRFDRIAHVPNTLPAHQVMHFAETEGADQTALAESLMRAFFESGENIGHSEVLAEITKQHGFSAADINKIVRDEKTRELVLAREATVRSSGMSGVPGFLLNRRLLVVGAQSKDTLINAFDRAMFGEGDDEPGAPILH